jgi:hypothetical protein
MPSGWTNPRRLIAYSAWIAALNSPELSEAELLRFLRKGLVLTQGRVPDSVRILYYRALGEWYARQLNDSDSHRLSRKFACLAADNLNCVDAQGSSRPTDGEPSWSLLLGSDDLYYVKDGWRLVGFDLDEDVLVAGIEAMGVLHWEKAFGDRIEQRRQLFAVPNLIPNPGFEFDGLYEGACIDGYLGSHVYVLPCVSHATHDPYHQRAGSVAVTETGESGYALFSPSFPVEGGRAYIVGGWLCADGGGIAAVGLERVMSASSTGEPAYQFVEWLLWQLPDPDQRTCWRQQAKVVYIAEESGEFRLRLDRRGGSEKQLGRAMFDDMFFFEIPAFEVAGTDQGSNTE